MKINFRLHAVKQTWQNAVETNLRATRHETNLKGDIRHETNLRGDTRRKKQGDIRHENKLQTTCRRTNLTKRREN